MARWSAFTFPLDKPIIEEPGLQVREADFHGSDVHFSIPPENPIRARKGDKSMKTIPHFEPRALSHPGLPFKDLKGGR